jgi:hypothetical protein
MKGVGPRFRAKRGRRTRLLALRFPTYSIPTSIPISKRTTLQINCKQNMAPSFEFKSPRGSSDDVVGTLVFAERENPKHAIEKPYNMRFDPGNGLARSNMEYETRKIKLQDLRSKNFNFDQHGLEMVEHQSAMQYEDFENAMMVEDIYLSEVAAMLEKLLNVHDVYIFEYVVSD